MEHAFLQQRSPRLTVCFTPTPPRQQAPGARSRWQSTHNKGPSRLLWLGLLLTMLASGGIAWADPCGMVPPLTATSADAITRVGVQKTYVFYKNGIESFVIRPGFSGKVSQFGMLIPFPTAPAIRKIPDNLFSQIAAAVDPPEIRVYVRSRRRRYRMQRALKRAVATSASKDSGSAGNWVKVLRQEAVGMYQVAVLEAGSAKALKAWMDLNKFRYPKGMDKPVEDYVKAGWCFVAVKTRVSGKSGISPQPGQRKTTASMPPNASFDGHVQGMGFRFKSKELVVPMRLSAFNKGKMRNIVYLLTDAPRQIRHIPEKYVVRQISGPQLHRNITEPLPIRVTGLSRWESERTVKKLLLKQYAKSPWLQKRRDPTPHNGLARALFAADLQSANSGKLILDFETLEKSFVNIGELLGLRGPDLDKLHHEALNRRRVSTTLNALSLLKSMTLSVIDGDFPRDVLAKDNLHFKKYTMGYRKNSPRYYNARLARPQRGWTKRRLFFGTMKELKAASVMPKPPTETWLERLGYLLGFAFLLGFLWLMMRRVNQVASLVLWFGLGLGAALALSASQKAHAQTPAKAPPANASKKAPPASSKDATAKPKAPTKATALPAATTQTSPAIDKKQLRSWIKALGDPAKASAARTALINAGTPALPYLWGAAVEGPALDRRGWAITALAAIGGKDVISKLQTLYKSHQQPALIRTWGAAAYLKHVSDLKTLEQVARETQRLGIRALERPMGIKLLQLVRRPRQANNITEVLLTYVRNPLFRKHAIKLLLKQPVERLTKGMIQGNGDDMRRSAAGILASFRSKESQNSIATALVKQLAFHPVSKETPWSNGALFIPQLQWRLHRAAAKSMFHQLMAWFLWCDVQKDRKCQRQIHNNIRSWGIARAIGYSPTWRFRGLKGWLKIHKRVFGIDATRGLFKQQRLDKAPAYQKLRQQLGLE